MNETATKPVAVTDADFAQQVLQSDTPVVGVRPKQAYEESLRKALG
jgi:hypothetical protein